MYIGDDVYGETLRRLAGGERRLQVISKVQRRVLAGSLAASAAHWPDRREAMARAYRSGAYTMREIADHFSVHYMTVSRVVGRFERLPECET